MEIEFSRFKQFLGSIKSKDKIFSKSFYFHKYFPKEIIISTFQIFYKGNNIFYILNMGLN